MLWPLPNPHNFVSLQNIIVCFSLTYNEEATDTVVIPVDTQGKGSVICNFENIDINFLLDTSLLFFLRLNSWAKSRQKSSLLFAVTSTALPWDFYFFKLTQPLTFSTVQLLYTVKEKRGKPGRKPYPLPWGLINPYKNLKSENSQDYAQKPQRNCKFMNLASRWKTPENISSICTRSFSQDMRFCLM